MNTTTKTEACPVCGKQKWVNDSCPHGCVPSTPRISQSAFFRLPEVVAQVNIQKSNPYGSVAHRAAWFAICAIANLHGVSEHFHPLDY